ncbi:hypothetical protein C7974DRAFT_397151 [Boeremia exigua]|uniref:uncharacterized protein n=1 Tax=Boeremia exigua TaxID=749465 RepID=UPI001E8D6499|nr:uncharacterized protein C7974DRAFT_397151 [Boeremia exigua]KAH6621791.1 hypothetical protein C7974DRAFT_397151 [Boeremia exigua]
MRLLHLDGEGNLGFVEYISDDVPSYAILSHTWSQTSKEVTFDAFISGEYAEKPGYKKSHEKIGRCGEQARKDGLQHFWVDTCCIRNVAP